MRSLSPVPPARLGHRPAGVTVTWVASHPGVTAPVLGARNLERREPSLDVPMTPEVRERIGQLYAPPRSGNGRTKEKK